MKSWANPVLRRWEGSWNWPVYTTSDSPCLKCWRVTEENPRHQPLASTYGSSAHCTCMYITPPAQRRGKTKWWGRFVFPKFKIDYRTCKTYTRTDRGLCWPDLQQDANTNQSQRRVLSFLSTGAGADACWRKGLDADLTPHAKADCTGEPMASCKSRDNFSRQWYRFSGPCIWQSIFKHTKHLTFVIPKHRQQN